MKKHSFPLPMPKEAIKMIVFSFTEMCLSAYANVPLAFSP